MRPTIRSDRLGTPKREIQLKVKAFAHAAADVSERGIASIHVIKIITVLQRAHQIYMQVIKTPLWNGDGLGGQACVAVDLALLAGQTPAGPGGDVAGNR